MSLYGKTPGPLTFDAQGKLLDRAMLEDAIAVDEGKREGIVERRLREASERQAENALELQRWLKGKP